MENMTAKLLELADPSNADFVYRLTPNVDRGSILGLRSPQIKALAKELSRDESKFEFLNNLPHKYFEENNLHGLLLNSASKDVSEVLSYVEKFLPYVDNWATCDSTVASLKIFKKAPDAVSEKVNVWLKSPHIFTVRFAIVTLLSYYLDENYDKSVLNAVAGVHLEEYYIKIAAAWFFSVALVKHYDDTLPYIQNKTLDKWTHNKSIQKAVESFRISENKKAYLKTLRQK